MNADHLDELKDEFAEDKLLQEECSVDQDEDELREAHDYERNWHLELRKKTQIKSIRGI